MPGISENETVVSPKIDSLCGYGAETDFVDFAGCLLLLFPARLLGWEK
jgi:hypothetical protein